MGFVEHGFRKSQMPGSKSSVSFVINRLELVSLLKFEEPRVYVLDHLPRMDQLSHANVPTRALNEFESMSLEKLWTEQDVVTEKVSDGYRMLGSLQSHIVPA